MCGIVACLKARGFRDASDTAAAVAAMNATLLHRGPDQDGIFVSADGAAGLGHKRLSILDLSEAGRQPMADASGRYTLAFNGEIYNHLELRAELEAKGHPIASRCDTEVLLYAYKEWGAACLGRLRGMFAFIVHDRDTGSLFAARDRLGIKPLYYGDHNGAVLLASECKAILAWPGFPRDLDPEALSDYLSFMYIPAPKSIYRRIRKLPAGHWMEVSRDGAIRVREWWDLEFARPGEGYGRPFAAARDDLLAAVDGSVAAHMHADVPLGAFLSGGIDSSAVVALMARHADRPVTTNTIGFARGAYDESDRARETAALFGTDHREYRVEPDALKDLEKLCWYYDEPFADSSMVPTYHVCAMARRAVTVALSGDGGDESFAGYRRYYYDRLENRVRALLPAALRGPVFGGLGAIYPKADWLPRPLRAQTLLRNLARDPLRAYFRSVTHIAPELKAALLAPHLRERLGGYEPVSAWEPHWRKASGLDPLSRVQYLDVKTYLADDILVKADRASMAVSLELRVPLLDHKVVELAARMPPDWKLSGRESKYILRSALAGVLPAELFRRPKRGFSVPLREWLRGPLRGALREGLLGADGPVAKGYFARPAVEAMLSEHQAGRRDHAYGLFALLTFALWAKRFGPPAP